MNEGVKRGWPAVGIWLVIQLTLTSLPGGMFPERVTHPWDWVAHLSMYGGLGFLVARAAMLRGWRLRRLLWAALIFSALAALDELHQLFIPGRDAEIGDWFFDTIGGALGLLVGLALMRSRVEQWLR